MLGGLQPYEPSKQEIEQERDCWIKLSQTNHTLSKEIKELIQRIGIEPASTQTNRILSNLFDGIYIKKTLPLFFLKEDLKQAGLTQLAHEISQRRFEDPALNPPRGFTERDFRMHEHQPKDNSLMH